MTAPRLRLATRGDLHQIDLRTASAWGAKLTLEQFLARETRLRAHPWPQRALRTWVWDLEGAILSSCETYEMPSRHGGMRGTTLAIASVFTPPEHRFQGHASRLLAEVLEHEFRGQSVQAAILYSEVGGSIYERLGFAAVPGAVRVWPSDAAISDSLTDGFASGTRADWEIEASAEQLDWHRERSRIYAEILKRPLPDAWGFQLGPASIDWSIDYRSECLRVLRFRARTQAEASRLLQAALHTAQRIGLPRVIAWETEQKIAWPKLATPSQLGDWNASLPMIRSNGRKLDASAWLPSYSTWV